MLWDGTPILKDIKDSDGRFELPKRGFTILQTLSDKANAIFEITGQAQRKRSRSHGDSDITFNISANIYGPRSSTDSVGLFLQKCGLYLQPPNQCEFDVPYVNLHCLSTDVEKVVMTSVFNEKDTNKTPSNNDEYCGLFDELGDEEQFEVELQPALVKTTLHR